MALKDNAEGNTPISIMHSNGLLSVEYTSFVCHHTGFVECGLSVENQNVSIAKMPINLLVQGRRPCKEGMFSSIGPLSLLGC